MYSRTYQTRNANQDRKSTPQTNPFAPKSFGADSPQNTAKPETEVDLDAAYEFAKSRDNMANIPVFPPGSTNNQPNIQARHLPDHSIRRYHSEQLKNQSLNQEALSNSGLPIQAKMTIGSPGDKYEQEADQVASQVVNQINSPTSQSTPEQSVQRQKNEEELQAKSTLQGQEAIDKVDSLDVVYELIAHKLAYKGIDEIPEDIQKWLDNQGYQKNWLGTVQGSGLFCGLIMPKPGSNKQPVLAFKGTDFSKTGDAMADADPVSVGFTAFKLKQDQIQALIDQAGGKVVVTGHSLGGALAQHAASAFTGSVSKVVTFQAPGISQEQVRQFNNNVNDMQEDERPEVVHHLATGDIVDLAGGKHIGGSGLYTGKGNAEFYLHHLESGGPMNHTKFLLQDQAFKQQQDQVGIDNEAHNQVGLTDSQIGTNQKVTQYNDNPFAGNQFIFERGREMAAPGAALLLGGKEIYQGGKGLANEGMENWRQGGAWNKTKGVGKMIGGGLGALAGGVTAGVGGVGALAGGLVGGLGGTIAVGAHKTVEGTMEGLSAGAKMGSSPGKALMSGGKGLATEGMENWQEGGFWNKTKGVGKIIGGGLGALAGGATAGVGGLAGGALGSVAGGLTGIPRSLWKRWKRE